jgi:hypothetical protein
MYKPRGGLLGKYKMGRRSAWYVYAMFHLNSVSISMHSFYELHPQQAYTFLNIVVLMLTIQ